MRSTATNLHLHKLESKIVRHWHLIIEAVADFDAWEWCKCSECSADGRAHAVDLHASLSAIVNAIRRAAVAPLSQSAHSRSTPNLTEVIEKIRLLYKEHDQTASRYFAEKDQGMEQYFSTKATAVSEVLTLLAPFIKTDCEYCNDADGYSPAAPHVGEQWIHRRRQTGEMFICRANHNYDCPDCGGVMEIRFVCPRSVSLGSEKI